MENINYKITDEGTIEFNCTDKNNNDIVIWFSVRFFNSGRSEDIELEISDFNDKESEMFYDDNWGDVENEILLRLTKTDIEKIKLNK